MTAALTVTEHVEELRRAAGPERREPVDRAGRDPRARRRERLRQVDADQDPGRLPPARRGTASRWTGSRCASATARRARRSGCGSSTRTSAWSTTSTRSTTSPSGVGYPSFRGRIRWRQERSAPARRWPTSATTSTSAGPVDRLAMSERTALAVARAMGPRRRQPKVLVLDEPTANLPAAEAQRLFQLAKRVARLRRGRRVRLAPLRRGVRARADASPCCATASTSSPGRSRA